MMAIESVEAVAIMDLGESSEAEEKMMGIKTTAYLLRHVIHYTPNEVQSHELELRRCVKL
ncbi:hypothetical protein SLEP1_g18349 [Rubroshorea leprosula]|uniref:Uncharacterized protein n=1 Tax=Rubroshorea leprosula TaxID=152421 RepID=A0AAV5J685_9ROSI|nr:hypothetical protein SLEP1_g18349 [Rubroshorea leprosula]